jgi:hypothetical protein
MKCQHCGHTDTAVLDTRSMLGASVIRRRRGCGQCGGRFDTYEIDGGIWGTVKKWALGSRTPALDKKHALRARDAEIAAMIQSGASHKEIAEKFGIATSTVCYAAKKAGLTGRRGPKRTKTVRNPWIGLL